MSKISKILIIALVVVISVKIVYASGSNGKVFGGRILKTEATEITTAEAESYNCEMNGGTSIEIRRMGTKEKIPTAFYIPPNTKSKTNTVLKAKQLIIGKYSGSTNINCPNDNPEIPPRIITLDNIILFGTSKN
ncbi:MAG: hypothetical protein V4504_01470 [Patescibacteria group bacterium]